MSLSFADCTGGTAHQCAGITGRSLGSRPLEPWQAPVGALILTPLAVL